MALFGTGFFWEAPQSLTTTSSPSFAALTVTDSATSITSGAQEINVVKISSLFSEELNQGNFASHDKWDVTGDFDDTGGNATYTHSAGSGTLTQTTANMVSISGLASARWYKFVYTVSGVTAGCTATITTAAAETAQTLTLTAATQTLYFLTKESPGNFVISVTSTAGGFTLDDLSLKEITGGDIYIGGTLFSMIVAPNKGGNNTGVGTQTYRDLTSGYDNVALGTFAHQSMTSGYQNVGVGKNAGQNNTTGYDNTNVGMEAGRIITEGYRNTCIGEEAGSSLTTGTNNLCLGHLAMKDAVTAASCIAIGNRTTLRSTDSDSTMSIADGIYGDFKQGIFSFGNALLVHVGTLTACTSNGTATIAKSSTWGFTPATGMLLHIWSATTAADKGPYRVVSIVANTSITVDRALSGSDSDVKLSVYQDNISLFIDNTNGPRIAGYGGTVNKPLQLGGSTSVATGHSLTGADILIPGILEVDGVAWFDSNVTFGSYVEFAGVGDDIYLYGGSKLLLDAAGGASLYGTTVGNNTTVTLTTRGSGLLTFNMYDNTATPVAPTNNAKFWTHNKDVVDDGTVTLPLITSAGFGFVTMGSNQEYAMFTVDGAGTVTLVSNSANVVANADTDTKLCIGTAATQEPLLIKNRLGATKTTNITLLNFD